ncbi:MAG: 2-amino-4-hydroxy-6-hydroxymethyldihydropteridine diphosphokinase [Alphaproteobacteria bacterium CG11_big_fil_rev_8_21_14_0_20_44_7]|nr:MAG: 2-amino-4-hydroxy-6-hydroxymethyldihydropteridine diphosphokinase [Alphaproteobacteria bacterium CG11_big_fil_rev_8_21_14_0_20_44_7]
MTHDDLIILGLGTNLGNREANLQKAISLIGNSLLNNIRQSKIYETTALLPANAPPEWDIDYLNMAISGHLAQEISPQQFLNAIKEIEVEMGRNLAAERWSPRIIDIDILVWGELQIDEPNLQIPHKELLTRPFAILPLRELAPDWEWLNN